MIVSISESAQQGTVAFSTSVQQGTVAIQESIEVAESALEGILELDYHLDGRLISTAVLGL